MKNQKRDKIRRLMAKTIVFFVLAALFFSILPVEALVDYGLRTIADLNVVDKEYLAYKEGKVVDNFQLGPKTASANPGTRARTVEYFLYQYDSSATNLSDDTLITSPGTTVNLPESTVTVTSAIVDFKTQSGTLSTAMDGFILQFGRTAGACPQTVTLNTRATAVGLTAPVADGTESKMYDLRADATADFTGYTGGTDQCVKFAFNLSQDLALADSTAEATYQGASAKLIITYTYDDTSATQLNTIYYPIEIATNQGTKAAQQAASTNADFTYTTTAPELTASGNLKNQFFEVNMRAGNSATTTDASYNFCRFASAACGTNTGLHYFEEALSRNAAGTRYLVDALPGFVYNDSAAALRVTTSASSVANFVGGMNTMTYTYANNAATKTKTVRYSVGEVITAAGSATKSALVGPTVILREGGVAVQKAWFRIQTSSSAVDGLQITTKVGANAETTADANDLYAFTANTIEAGQANYINHIIPSADYAAINSGALTGVATQMTADWTTGGGSVSAELFITYTYTDESTGWTSTRVDFGGQQQVNGTTTFTQTTGAINTAVPDTGGTVAIQSQYIHMQQHTSLATVVANQARGINLTTSTCTPSDTSTAESTALANNFALYKSTGAIVTNNDATTYTACASSTTSSELSLFNMVLYYTVSVSITPSTTLTISVSAGSKLANVDSGATSAFVHDVACTTDGTCAAFKMAAAGGGTATVTSIKITETGTVTANTELTNPTIIYDTDANYSNGTGGTFGTLASWAADQTATITGSVGILSGNTYYFYVRTDFLNGSARPDGGLTVNYQIAAATDVVSDFTESGSGTLAGTTTVRPNVTGITNATEGGLTDGARTSQTLTIAGHGFGTTCDGTTKKVEIGTYALSCTGASFSDTSISIAIDAGVNVYGGTAANGALVTIGSTADDARTTWYVYPDITSLSPTAATGAKEGDNVVITGTKFRATQGTGSVQFTNCNSTSGTIVGWGDTSITVTVPAGVLDTDDSCDIVVTRDTDAKTKTSTGYVILPSITSITVPTGVADAGREYNAADSDGIITINGTHFGAAGSVTILGSTATQVTTGTCTGTAYQATCVGLQIPTAIADSTYTGDIVITRTSDSKNHTYAGFRVLPRIASTSPVNLKAGRGDTITLTGDHFCQGGCPASFSSVNKVSFQGGEVTSGASIWTHTSIPSVVVPGTALDGNLTMTSSTSYTSNALTFDIKFAPTTPTNSVPTNGATGQSQNPTTTSDAFSDGTDGDAHSVTNWEITDATGNYAAGQVVWTRTSSGAEVTIVVNTTNGTFANALVGQTQLACGTTYYWHVRYKDNAGVSSQEWSSFSGEFSFSTSACTPTLTIGVTQGTKVSTVNSGATSQYAHDTNCTSAANCSVFTLTISTGSETVTSVKITETGTTAADTDLANLALFYDTDGNWSDAGAETQYGSTVAAFDASQTATPSGSLVISTGNTYYFYVRYDLAKSGVYPKGGQTVNFQIAAGVDIGTSGSPVKTGAPQSLAGTQTVLPNATTIQKTVLPDGGRSGDSILITGFGFGVPSAGVNREDCTTATVDRGCIKFVVGGTTNVANANISAWSNTQITFTIAAGLASDGGNTAVELRAANQADTTRLTFYVYPRISSLTVPTAVADASREYDSGDSDGVFTANGDHFGAAGTVTILGSTGTQQTTGTCTGTAYQATCTGLQVPTAISDSTYTGDVVVSRTSDSKDHTYSGFRILPRIASNTAASGIPADRIKILGDHFCETGTCPVSPNRSTASDNVLFGATQAADSDFVSSGAAPCSGNAQGWTHSEICINVPAATPEGSQPTLVESNSYLSNTKAFTRSTTVPNAPTNLRQFKADGSTSLGTGATTNESTVVLKADISATVAIPMILQVEVDPSGAGFDGTGITDGNGCTCTSSVDRQAIVGSLTTGGKHWRARTKNTTTSETSAWVEFQAGTGADFTVDVNGPVITFPGGDTCAGSQSSLGTNSVIISWSLDESADGQVEYSTNVDLTSSTNYPSSPEASGVSHAITLANLNSNTTYYYKVKSTDAATNLSTKPTAQPFCSFTTSSVSQPGKTTSFYIAGATGSISAATNYYFTVVAPETSPSVKSAFVEVTGIVSGGSNPIDVKVNGVATKSYSVSAASATQYRFVYEITSPNSEANLNLNDANPCTNGAGGAAPCNKLTVTPGSGMTVNITSARIIVNYAYTP